MQLLLSCVWICVLALAVPTHAFKVRSLPQRTSTARTPTALSAKRRTTLSRRKDKDASVEGSTFGVAEVPAVQEVQPFEPSSVSLPQSLQTPTRTAEAPRSISDQLQSDISIFQERSLQAAQERSSSSKPESGAVNVLKSVFSAVLIADFFVVIAFLLWFLAAAAMQKTNPFLLEKFQDIFQPVVVPSLTVLMAGSIASGVISKDKEDN